MVDFATKLIEGTLVRRYKRFLADVRLTDGSIVTVHVANTGAMTGCAEPGMRAWLSRSDSGKRKYPLSLELMEVRHDVLVSVNTAMTNAVVRQGIEGGTVMELQGYKTIHGEVKLGASRIDLLLRQPGEKCAADPVNREPGPQRISSTSRRCCWVEVKSVTLVDDGFAFFPDSVSIRGTRHLRELKMAAHRGDRAVVFFCVQRSDAGRVQPAYHIDPDFGEALKEAAAGGVEAIAYKAKVTLKGVRLAKPLPIQL